MIERQRGGLLPRGSARRICARIFCPRRRQGVILLAVLVFIALLLPLVTLVLSSVNTETLATSEAIKGAKAEMGTEKALNDAISLVVQEKALPSYYTSAAQPDTAIIVLDQATGVRRDQLPDQGAAGGAGTDDILGTADDYWIGPRFDRTYNGNTDPADNPRMYRYGFSFPSLDAPTYLGQSWSFSATNDRYGRSPSTNNRIWMLNQYGAVDGIDPAYGNIDDDSDLVDEGFDPADTSNFVSEAELHGPGYYLRSDEPRTGGPGGPVNRDLADPGIRQALYNAKVNLYESVFNNMDRGPMPTSMLKSYADVTDEAGRLNLNMFCKKARVWMPEAAETDYDFDGYGTNDFNLNETPDEAGWKWVDNPIFPDRDTTRKWDLNPGTGSFTDLGPIDWGSMDASTGLMVASSDTFSMPMLGETVQHYYEGDTDGDGIPQSVEAMKNSIQMLVTLPGVSYEDACRILTLLNPPHESSGNEGFDLFSDGSQYAVLRSDYNSNASSITPATPPANTARDYRLDACNVTPALTALEINIAGGTVTDFRWAFGATQEDDMPLPKPRPLASFEELAAAGLTEAQIERIAERATIFSYDTNVIGTYIQDIAPNADTVNAFLPGDPEYSGATLRETPQALQDEDNVPDLRFDVDRFVFGATLSDYRANAEEMYAHLRNHLPRPLLDKITLPVVDRMGRSSGLDHLVDNSDQRYDPTLASGGGTRLLPHRDDDVKVYNVGETGREDDPDAGGPAEPTDYPALNTPFSLDSCLSIVLYRNGTLLEDDDYTYDPSNGAWLPFANRGLFNFFPFGIPVFLDILGPFGDLIRSFFEPNNNPSPFAGLNVNPEVRAHGAGVFEINNMLQGGNFDSPADLLNVPLYKLGRMSVSLMADPPSDFRFDADTDGSVDGGNPAEASDVSYYFAFSDVVDVGWYLENVAPDGPDLRPNTADDPDLSRVLYRLRFTAGNRPAQAAGANPLTDVYEVDITGYMLRAVGGGAENGNTKITVALFDNLNNLDLLSPDFDSAFAVNFDWQNVPFPEEDASAGAVGADPNARPDNGGDWPAGQPAHSDAWAYDAAGDPYITARVEVIKWDDGAGAPATPEERCDQVCKVYLQYNTDADIPFMVSILPVRISGDLYEMRSSIGGPETSGGSYVLYDWDYEDSTDGDTEPDDFDGTWPRPQTGQAPTSQIIQIRPEVNTVTLRVYDLRTFIDSSNPFPVAGYPALMPAVWAGDRVAYPPVLGGSFPVDYGGNYPLPGTPGYAEDSVTVQPIEDVNTVVSEVSALEPSVFADDTSVRIQAAAAGGRAPYDYRVRILDPNRGSGAGGVNPYLCPDGAGGGVNTWPSPVGPNGSRPSQVTAPGVPYDPSFGGSVLLSSSQLGVNSVETDFTFNTSALAAGQYWVELRVQDSDGATPDSFTYTKLVVGTDNSPAGAAGVPPAMNASITLRQFEGGGPGSQSSKGFTAQVAVDGGSGSYKYYWEVRQPVYGGPGGNPEVTGEQIVPVGLAADAATGFTSNEANPSFQFVNSASSDGVYFLHCWVIDAGTGAASGQRSLAHDVAMVTLYDTSATAGDPASINADALARTPMAVLAARTPGNGGSGRIGSNSAATGGSGRPYLGVSPTLVNTSVVEPDVAGAGEVVIIRGFNFAPAATDNIVRFGGDVTARAFGLVTLPDTITIGASVYNQQELSVVVPDGAKSGYLNVTSPTGTSDRIFFQTGYNVEFDLIGKLSPNDPSYLRFELDFQSDGKIDYTFNTQSNPSHPGILRSGEDGVSIVHDYAADGIGNHDATLVVTDLISQRRQVSHQIITIKDLRPASTGELTISSGVLDSAAVVAPFTLVDADGKFNSVGVQPGDIVVNLASPLNTTSVISRDSDTQLTLLASVFAPGQTAYEIRRSITGSNINAMIANIWPVADLRSETFAPNPAPTGTSFGSAVAGIASSGIKRKWQIDGSGANSSATAGQIVEQGCVTQEDITGLHLYDNTKNFLQSGNFGVREGDLVINTTDGSRANVREVQNATTILLAAANNNSIGLTGGAGVLRSGVADNIISDNSILYDQLAPPAPSPYDFDGAGCQNQGGILPGDTIVNVTTGASATVLTVDVPAEGILTCTPLSGSFLVGGHKGFGTAQAGSGGDILNGGPGSFPPGLVSVGDIIERWVGGVWNGSTWAGGVMTHTGTVTQRDPVPPPNQNLRSSFNAPWAAGDHYIIRDASGINGNLWRNGDVWQVLIGPNEWRMSFEYTISTSDGFLTGSTADASYADAGALIDFDVQMTYPWDLDASLTNPTLVLVDWDADGAVDNTYPVGVTTRTGGGNNMADSESIRLRHAFTIAECTPRAGKPGFLSRARYRVSATPAGQLAPNVYPSAATWYNLPAVVISADEFDNDLTTLNLDSWGVDNWHRVTMESQYAHVTSQTLQGVNAPLNRFFYASDESLVPPGMGSNYNSLATWVSFNSPFMFSNAVGNVSMRHTAVHGEGGALNYVSDVNADGEWAPGSIYESPQGDNPVNFHEFIFNNGPNNMAVPGGGGLLKGASFPLTFPGATSGTGTGLANYLYANYGLYNGFGFVTDNLPADERAFSFDSQAIMLGRSETNVNNGITLGTGLDFYIEPIVTSNSAFIQLSSFVTGLNSSTAPVRYRWEVRKISGPGYIGPIGLDGTYNAGGGFTAGSSNAPNPVFTPAADMLDEAGASGSGAGQYRVWLSIDINGDNIADVVAPSRIIEVVTPPLQVFMMADPPSTSVGSPVDFHVFVDGGTPDYRVEMDFDGDGTYEETQDLSGGNEITFTAIYDTPSNDVTDLTGDYLPQVRVTDSAGGVPFGGVQDVDEQVVKVAETIPLNASLLVNPPSGVAPFVLDVHYSVSGGSPFSGDEYNVLVSLISTSGEGQPSVFRTESTTLGANRQLEDPRDPNVNAADIDDPVVFFVPEPGNYYVQLTVFDNDGRTATITEDVFATGYLAPLTYGNSTPRVVKDANGRPMHAVRVWVDPFLNIGGGNANAYQNQNEGDDFGGRLMEADLQVIGDMVMTDPNASFRSLGNFATKDPAQQPLLFANYATNFTGENLVQDFYDTFSPGRININTASEEVLTALFSRIVKSRAYMANNASFDNSGDGDTDDPGEQFYFDPAFEQGGAVGPDLPTEQMRNVRDYANDLMITDLNNPGDGLDPQAPRRLAQAVVRYRSMFFDSQKPDAPGGGQEFGYSKAGSGDPDLGDFRVDHLPVVGPFDGVNPHVYDVSDRNADLLDADDANMPNSWDNMAGTYYNFDPAEQLFYAPSDVAVVRGRYEVQVAIDANGDGDTNDPGDFVQNTFENPADYAKYLNDVVTNEFWYDNRYSSGTIDAAWNALGLYPDDNNYYSRWAFDARNYFRYEGGAFQVRVDATNPANFSVTQLSPPGDPEDARNQIGVFQSNGETAYSFIPNAPFNNIFDLYKVISSGQAPRTFGLSGTQIALDPDFTSNTTQVISGPSVFRCVQYWDEARSEFIPLANYLDDIAPFITTRSYVFRVSSSAAVQVADGGSLDTGSLSRERGKTAVIDLGKMWAQRNVSAIDSLDALLGLTPDKSDKAWRLLWSKAKD